MTSIENSPYTDPSTSPRESPLKDSASKVARIGASITGLINLAAMGGLVTAGVAGDLNLAVGIVLASIPVVTTLAGQYAQAVSIVRRAWSQLTPIDSPKVIDGATGRLIALVPQDGRTLAEVAAGRIAGADAGGGTAPDGRA